MAGEIFGCCGWHQECRSLGHCVRELQHGDDICAMRKWIGGEVKKVIETPKLVEKPKAATKPVQRKLF